MTGSAEPAARQDKTVRQVTIDDLSLRQITASGMWNIAKHVSWSNDCRSRKGPRTTNKLMKATLHGELKLPLRSMVSQAGETDQTNASDHRSYPVFRRNFRTWIASARHISKPSSGFGLQAKCFESRSRHRTTIDSDKSCLLTSMDASDRINGPTIQ